jgi:hypothetical protein
MKTTIVCDDWKALHRNTLLGFASIKIPELHLSIRDIAIHQKNGHRWAQLPAKPQIKDGAVVKDSTGRVVYFPMLAFDSREVANAFSAAVVDWCTSPPPSPMMTIILRRDERATR